MVKGGIELLMSFLLVGWYVVYCSRVLSAKTSAYIQKIITEFKMVRESIYLSHAHMLSHPGMFGVISGVFISNLCAVISLAMHLLLTVSTSALLRTVGCLD